MKIKFEDNGQDFLWWELDNEGFVINAGPFQASVWVGSQVYMPEHIQPGDELDYIDKWGEPRTLIHLVDAIILEGEE